MHSQMHEYTYKQLPMFTEIELSNLKLRSLRYEMKTLYLSLPRPQDHTHTHTFNINNITLHAPLYVYTITSQNYCSARHTHSLRGGRQHRHVPSYVQRITDVGQALAKTVDCTSRPAPTAVPRVVIVVKALARLEVASVAQTRM